MQRNTYKTGEIYYVLDVKDVHRLSRELLELIKYTPLGDKNLAFTQSFRNSALDRDHQFTPGSIVWINRILRSNGMEELK